MELYRGSAKMKVGGFIPLPFLKPKPNKELTNGNWGRSACIKLLIVLQYTRSQKL